MGFPSGLTAVWSFKRMISKGGRFVEPGVYYYLGHTLHDHPDPWVSISSTVLGRRTLTEWG